MRSDIVLVWLPDKGNPQLLRTGWLSISYHFTSFPFAPFPNRPLTMYELTYPVFPIFSFVGFVVALIPLPWHLQAWNSGTCFYMMWASIACLNQFVNSVVWANDAINKAPLWCEICRPMSHVLRSLLIVSMQLSELCLVLPLDCQLLLYASIGVSTILQTCSPCQLVVLRWVPIRRIITPLLILSL